MTAQPQWRCVAQLGDANPLDYGGFWVFVDDTGVYPPEAEYYSPDDNRAWRIVLDQCTHINGVLSDNRFHPELQAWFADDLESVASCTGGDVATMRANLCSADAIRRALAYRDILSYHGWDNGDSCPLELTEQEAHKRYGDSKYI